MTPCQSIFLVSELSMLSQLEMLSRLVAPLLDPNSSPAVSLPFLGNYCPKILQDDCEVQKVQQIHIKSSNVTSLHSMSTMMWQSSAQNRTSKSFSDLCHLSNAGLMIFFVSSFLSRTLLILLIKMLCTCMDSSTCIMNLQDLQLALTFHF